MAWALWPRPIAVETAVIGKRTIAVEVEEEGKSRIREVFAVSAPIAGRMKRIDLHAGDAVTAGRSVVARLQPMGPGLLDERSRKIAEAAVAAAHAAVDLARARLAQAQAQLGFLKGEFARASKLIERGTISERAFEKAKLDSETAQAEVDSAKASLTVRERELESAEAALLQGMGETADDCCVEVKAPVTGEVLRVLTESEQAVLPGAALLEIGDPADLEVAADLLSKDAVRISVGAQALIEGWGGNALPARVSRIDPSAFTKVSALGIEEQRVPVVLQFADGPSTRAGLGHDFRVFVRIEVWKGQDLTAVPLGALFRRGEGWAVFTIIDGEARLTDVKLGERNSEYAEIKDGLGVGDVVVLHPGDLVADGVSVASGAN
jgi:HlyD family secretion protein